MEKRLSPPAWRSTRITHGPSLIDDASDVGTTFAEVNIPQDVYSVRNERALSSFDRRHRFGVLSDLLSSYRSGPLLSPRGIAGKFVSGWTFAGLGSAKSGAPFTVTLPIDNDIGAGPAQRPSVIGNPNAGTPHTPQQWFNTSVFLLPGQFMFGSAGRNIVRGDSEVGMDVSLLKETPVSERIRVQLRAEMFNAWNHTNFADTPGKDRVHIDLRSLHQRTEPAPAPTCDQAAFLEIHGGAERNLIASLAWRPSNNTYWLKGTT